MRTQSVTGQQGCSVTGVSKEMADVVSLQFSEIAQIRTYLSEFLEARVTTKGVEIRMEPKQSGRMGLAYGISNRCLRVGIARSPSPKRA